MAVQTFKIPESIKKDMRYSFCPGCDHGVAVRLVAEVLDELDLRENTVAPASIPSVLTLGHSMPASVSNITATSASTM